MSTSTVVEQVSSLVDAVGREHAAQRRQSFGRYRDLLLKNHKPTKGDAEQLRSLLDELRLTPDDMRRHLALLQEAQRHEAITGESDAAQQRYDQADKQAKKHKRETARIVTQRGERQAQLDDERMETMCRVKDIHLAGRLVEKLHDEHRELFGREPVEAVAGDV